MRNDNRLAYGSIICSALLLPGTILIGKTVEYMIKSINPNHIEVHGVLAYLGVILISSMIVFGLITLTAAGLAWALWRNGEKKMATLSMIILVSEIAATILILVLNSAVKNL